MARTKTPCVVSTAKDLPVEGDHRGKQPVTYASRQVEIRVGESSKSGPSKKRQRDGDTENPCEKTNMKKQKGGTSASGFGKKCSPNSVIEMLDGSITPAREAILQKLGLGCLLNLKMRRFDMTLLGWMTRVFDVDSMSISMEDGGGGAEFHCG
ncbi:unnamed protein product [Linum trigynum]|uniref:Uncharacterized protein n=1 Tax=Linum trigynum TaxID=586398 RepID=A0AAV2FD38_9ROSI